MYVLEVYNPSNFVLTDMTRFCHQSIAHSFLDRLYQLDIPEYVSVFDSLLPFSLLKLSISVIFGVIEIAFLFQPQLQLTASMVYSANIYVSVVSTVFASGRKILECLRPPF